MEFLLKADKRPDVIHCHDWQTGLVPVLLFETYQQYGMHDQRVCYTIHNFSHQGITREHILWATGLTRPERFFDYDRLRDNFNPNAINLMKGGIVYSNFVTTVSPQYASEVTYTDQGMGLPTRSTSTRTSSAECSTGWTTACGTLRWTSSSRPGSASNPSSRSTRTRGPCVIA